MVDATADRAGDGVRPSAVDPGPGPRPDDANHDRAVARHYHRDGLLAAIDAALAEMGRQPDEVSVDLLAPVDEFHVGGREATLHLVHQLRCRPGARMLDLGCGIGGTARLLASSTARDVVGVDLTPDFVEAGRELNRRVGLDDRIELRVGSALDLADDDASYDGAVMLHVGMNVEDKATLLAEVARVLRPGGGLAVYDLMRVGAGEVDFPVPWSSDPSTSHLARPEEYRAAAREAGLALVSQTDRSAYAAEFFGRLRAARAGRSPLGLHLVMGPEAPTKVSNMIAAVTAGVIAPTELVLTRT